jgi:AcrR family transcriptional regulator
MQIQKDTVKNKIIEAATDEFSQKGYNLASMRNIASKADITVGNVYSYFENKADLFTAVVSPVYEDLNRLIMIKVKKEELLSAPTILQITDEITKLFIKYKIEFFILMNGSEWSPYMNTKKKIIDNITMRIMHEGLPNKTDSDDLLFFNSVSTAIIDGLFYIFENYENSEERLKQSVNQFLSLIFGYNKTQ